MDRVGVFVDIGNQYYCVSKKWPGKKLDYQQYITKATNGKSLQRAFAYGTQVEDNAVKFITCLKHIGFEARYKTVEKNAFYSWDAGIAVDMIKFAEKLDTVVLGSSNRSMVPAVKALRERGVKVIVLACGISRELKDVVDKWVEITEDMLEAENEEAITA